MELLIAMSISGFIILGMTQGSRNIQKILVNTRIKLQMNKSVCLAFNQIERDFNTAFIPFLYKEETAPGEKKPGEKKTESKKPLVKKKPGEKSGEKKAVSLFFIGEIYDDRGRKIEGEEYDKKYELFKSASFVNTNPLQVWGQKKSRLVRVGYELLRNKTKSKREKY